MKKTMIHFDPVKNTSETHNNRKIKLNYVRSDLSHLNEKWVENENTISERYNFIAEKCKLISGRAMQKNAIPIREAVVLLEEHHNMVDLQFLTAQLHDKLGISTFQIYIHKDEGHFDINSKEWIPNYHAHLISDFQNKNTGKMLGLNRKQMSEMQDIAADCLGMKRGDSKGSIRLSAVEYKLSKKTEELSIIEASISEIINEKTADFDELIVEKKNILGLKSTKYEKTLNNYQNALKILEKKLNKAKQDNDKNFDRINVLQKNNLELTNRIEKLLKENLSLLTNDKFRLEKLNIYNEKMIISLKKEAYNTGISNPNFMNLNQGEKTKIIREFLNSFFIKNKLPKSYIEKELKNILTHILQQIEIGAQHHLSNEKKSHRI